MQASVEEHGTQSLLLGEQDDTQTHDIAVNHEMIQIGIFEKTDTKHSEQKITEDSRDRLITFQKKTLSSRHSLESQESMLRIKVSSPQAQG